MLFDATMPISSTLIVWASSTADISATTFDPVRRISNPEFPGFGDRQAEEL